MISFNCKELQIFRQSSLAYDCSSKGQCPPSRSMVYMAITEPFLSLLILLVCSQWIWKSPKQMRSNEALLGAMFIVFFFLLKNSLTSTGIQSWTFLSQGMTRFRILTTRRLSMFLLRIPLQAHVTLIRWTLCGTIVSTVLQSCFCCLWRRSIADHPMPRR